MDTVIRGFNRADIPFALEQTGREGWDATAEFFETLLKHDPGGCFIAVRGDQPAGMVTTTRYSGSAWIGNVIVPPQFRKESIGSSLMQHAIRHLEDIGVRCVRLEADPLGINIYRRLGFRDEYESPRFRNDHAVFHAPTDAAPLQDSDLQDACQLDRRVFGDDRSRLLSILFHKRVAAYRAPRSGPMAGFIFLQDSRAGYRLGPWVANDAEIARTLLSAAGSGLPARPVVVALPGVNRMGLELLAACGFRQTPSSLRMFRGARLACGAPECVYGLAGGAIG